MKHTLLSTMLLLAVALVACGSPSEPTPTPTISTPIPQTPTVPSEPPPTPSPSTPVEPGEAVEPGGIDVALDLVTIPDQEIIAVVNGEELPTDAYEEELNRALQSVTNNYAVDWNDPQNQSLLPTLQKQVLDQLIQRELLHQLAEEEEVTVDPAEIDAEIASIQAQIEQDETIADWESFLAENNFTEEYVRSLIVDNKLMEGLAEQHGGPKVAEQVHASHILVETEETAQEVMDKLDEGEDFADLAAEYSTDPGSKDQGGDLGWFPSGAMVPEFDEVAFSLEPGEISDPVETSYGYHVILVHEKEERELDPALYAQRQQQMFQTWFEDQQSEANIERLYDFSAETEVE